MPIPFYILRVSCGFDAYGRPRSNIDFPLCLQMKLIWSHDDTSKFFFAVSGFVLYDIAIGLDRFPWHSCYVHNWTVPCDFRWGNNEMFLKENGGGCWSFCDYVGCSSPFHCLADSKRTHDEWHSSHADCIVFVNCLNH